MLTTDDRGARLGRRQFLGRLLVRGAGTGLAIAGVLRAWPGVLTALAAPARKPAPPPPVGYPPNNQTPTGITVPPDDPAISAGPVTYPGMITPLMGYLSVPKGGETYPGVLVLHDANGLTESIRDLTRRLAKVGYVALAPDLLSREGGTTALGDQARITAALGDMGMSQFIDDLNTSVRYLEARPLADKSRIGALGIGMGGNLTWPLLVENSDIKAAAILDGGIPPFEAVAHITAAVLAIFGETEQQETSQIPSLDAAMKKAGMPWQYKVEPKAGPGFSDYMTSRYVAAAAQDAWHLTLDWFHVHLAA
jgi:carboxymethylenebutenolidase